MRRLCAPDQAEGEFLQRRRERERGYLDEIAALLPRHRRVHLMFRGRISLLGPQHADLSHMVRLVPAEKADCTAHGLIMDGESVRRQSEQLFF